MWYAIDADGFNREELLGLYRLVEQRERAFREDLFRFTNFYSAVCYAILAMTLSGFVSLYGKGPILLSLLLGPALTLLMCLLGIRVTTRIYLRVVREISIKIKIENALGLDRQIRLGRFCGEKTLWEQDQALLPGRHIIKRGEHQNSQTFIDASVKGGFSRDNRTYFAIIGFFSVILAIVIAVTSLIAF